MILYTLLHSTACILLLCKTEILINDCFAAWTVHSHAATSSVVHCWGHNPHMVCSDQVWKLLTSIFLSFFGIIWELESAGSLFSLWGDIKHSTSHSQISSYSINLGLVKSIMNWFLVQMATVMNITDKSLNYFKWHLHVQLSWHSKCFLRTLDHCDLVGWGFRAAFVVTYLLSETWFEKKASLLLGSL